MKSALTVYHACQPAVVFCAGWLKKQWTETLEKRVDLVREQVMKNPLATVAFMTILVSAHYGKYPTIFTALALYIMMIKSQKSAVQEVQTFPTFGGSQGQATWPQTPPQYHAFRTNYSQNS